MIMMMTVTAMTITMLLLLLMMMMMIMVMMMMRMMMMMMMQEVFLLLRVSFMEVPLLTRYVLILRHTLFAVHFATDRELQSWTK